MHLIVTCAALGAGLALPAAAQAEKVHISAPSTPATQITDTSARLAGILQSDRIPSTVRLQVGRTTAYGFTTKDHLILYLGSVEAWATIYGMAPATTYHFRFVATNFEGTTLGPDRTVTTLASSGTPAAENLSEEPPPPTDPTPTPPPAPAPSDPLATPDLIPPLAPVTAGDVTAGPSTDHQGAAPVLLPTASRSVVAGPVSGTVTIKAPGAAAFTTLAAAAAIPVGSIVDARHGALELSADTGADVDTGRFWGAVFRVSQPAGAGGAAEMSLTSGRPARCSRDGGRARAAAAKKPAPGLWGKDSGGRFRMRGRNSVATVRGTVWYVGERCAGTVTRVIRGAVAVRDTRTGRTVVVHAGHHLMVRDHAHSARRGR